MIQARSPSLEKVKRPGVQPWMETRCADKKSWTQKAGRAGSPAVQSFLQPVPPRDAGDFAQPQCRFSGFSETDAPPEIGLAIEAVWLNFLPACSEASVAQS